MKELTASSPPMTKVDLLVLNRYGGDLDEDIQFAADCLSKMHHLTSVNLDCGRLSVTQSLMLKNLDIHELIQLPYYSPSKACLVTSPN